MKSKHWVVLGIVVFITFILFAVLKPTGNATKTPGKYDSFAQCLTEKGTKMYGAFWCPHCQDQKEDFGSSWKYVTYIECSLPDRSGQTPLCQKEGIESYPTWEFSDKSREKGVMTLNELSEKTGCPLPE